MDVLEENIYLECLNNVLNKDHNASNHFHTLSFSFVEKKAILYSPEKFILYLIVSLGLDIEEYVFHWNNIKMNGVVYFTNIHK